MLTENFTTPLPSEKPQANRETQNPFYMRDILSFYFYFVMNIELLYKYILIVLVGIRCLSRLGVTGGKNDHCSYMFVFFLPFIFSLFMNISLESSRKSKNNTNGSRLLAVTVITFYS